MESSFQSGWNGMKSFHSVWNEMAIPFRPEWRAHSIPAGMEWSHSIPTGMEWALHSIQIRITNFNCSQNQVNHFLLCFCNKIWIILFLAYISNGHTEHLNIFFHLLSSLPKFVYVFVPPTLNRVEAYFEISIKILVKWIINNHQEKFFHSILRIVLVSVSLLLLKRPFHFGRITLFIPYH